MKIAIIQGAFFPVPPLRGGAVEKVWWRLGREFAERGHDVTHVSRSYPGLDREGLESEVNQIRVRGYDQPSGGLLLKIRDLQYSLRAVRRVPLSDIIITNSFWAPVLLRRRQGVYVSVQRMPKGQLRLYRSARLHACSSAVRDAIVAEDRSAAVRTCMIPNPLSEIPVGGSAWSKREKRILFVGRLHPEKGIELLLAAFRRAGRDRVIRGWKLVVVGPSDASGGGGGKKWVETLRQKYGSEDVEFTGPIYDAAELALQYQRARLFVYPSLAERGETFGVAPLEAMSWGMVPVVSDLACFRDFIDVGKNGFVFNHRSPAAEETFAKLLVELVCRSLEVESHAALGVRISHNPARIADSFLADFALTVTHGVKHPKVPELTRSL